MKFRDFRSTASPVRATRRRDDTGPVVFERESGRGSVIDWLGDHANDVEAAVLEAGAVLLRGFAVDAPDKLDQALRTLYGEPMSYRENTSLRTPLSGGVRTSTDHPADQWIEQHSEQSYSCRLPMRLLLACARPAGAGGETPIADTRRILARLSPGLLDRLRDGYLYRCRFRPVIRPHWRETYEVDDRAELERYLGEAGIDWRWEGDELITEIRRPLVVAHPLTGESAWFNHLLFWHHSSLQPELATELLRQFGEQALPHGVFHADGRSLQAGDIAEIRAAHHAELWPMHWRAGDLLILDNLLRTHGRAPFDGERRVMFAMALPLAAEELARPAPG